MLSLIDLPHVDTIVSLMQKIGNNFQNAVFVKIICAKINREHEMFIFRCFAINTTTIQKIANF